MLDNPDFMLTHSDVLDKDNQNFEYAHAKGAKEFEWPWLKCNENAIKLLAKYGYDAKRSDLRAIVSLAILSTMRTLKE